MKTSLPGRTQALALATVLCCGNGVAGTEIRGPAEQVRMVELFTSEGCSSCPPADRWLRTLAQHPRLWTDIVPLAFHVDYWDDLGWRDRFARRRFSDRQRRYRLEGGIDTVYTPGFVVNGDEWRGWFSGRSEPPATGERPGAMTIELDEHDAVVTFEPTASASRPRLVAHLALLGFGLESAVRAGENRGATLAHDFVVLGLTSAPFEPGERYIAKLILPRTDQSAEHYAVAAWVSAAGRQQPIQAVGGFIDSPGTAGLGYPGATGREQGTGDE